MYHKPTVQPWGSYQLAYSLDGHSFMVFPDFFGWGWEPPEALSRIFLKWVDEGNIPDEVRQFMSDEMADYLLTLKGD